VHELFDDVFGLGQLSFQSEDLFALGLLKVGLGIEDYKLVG
jgi:hypothetical protein